MEYGFVKVAAATPEIRVADCDFNTENVLELWRQADEQGCQLVVFPELVLTGYTCSDLFLQPVLLDGCLAGLKKIAGSQPPSAIGGSGGHTAHPSGQTIQLRCGAAKGRSAGHCTQNIAAYLRRIL